jgi:hypothetical protein
MLLLLSAALAAPAVIVEVDDWGYTHRVTCEDTEILGFYVVLSGAPDIVPPVAVPLLSFTDVPEIGGTRGLHVARSVVLEAHWPGRMILRGVHDTTWLEYPRVASLVVVDGEQALRVTEWLLSHDGWPSFLATFAGAQLGEDAEAVATALGALLQPMVDPARISTVPIAPRGVPGGLEVTLSASPNWLVVLVLRLDNGRLTGLSMDQRRPAPDPEAP